MVRTALFASAPRRMSSGSTENVDCARTLTDASAAASAVTAMKVRRMPMAKRSVSVLELHGDENDVLERAFSDVLAPRDAAVDDELPRIARRRDAAVEAVAGG